MPATVAITRVELDCGHVQAVFALAGKAPDQVAYCGRCLTSHTVVGAPAPTTHPTITHRTSEA